MAFLWVLNLADGRHTLLDVAERAGLPFAVVAEAARLLRSNGLLVEEDCAATTDRRLPAAPATAFGRIAGLSASEEESPPVSQGPVRMHGRR